MFESRWVRHNPSYRLGSSQIALTTQHGIRLREESRLSDGGPGKNRLLSEVLGHGSPILRGVMGILLRPALQRDTVLPQHSLPLVHSEAQFIHPISYGDTVHCTITVPRIGKTSIHWHYEFRNQEGVLCWIADQVTVCTDMRAVESKLEVPGWMREGLAKMEPTD